MTLIVGILCADGVVMAADSEATMGSPGSGLTAAQRTAHKLTTHQDRIITGFSGFMGLAQRLTPTLEQTCRSNLDSAPDRLMAKVTHEMAEIVKPLYEMSQITSQALRSGEVVSYSVPCALIALPVQKKPKLLRLYENCQTEYSTEDLPFVAIGSGQKYAEPFLAFLRSTFWPATGLPSVADAEFFAYWTLEHVIATHALGGIGGEIQLAALTKDDKGEWKAALRKSAEHAVHADAIERVREVLRNWRSEFGEAPTAPKPEAPPT